MSASVRLVCSACGIGHYLSPDPQYSYTATCTSCGHVVTSSVVASELPTGLGLTLDGGGALASFVKRVQR